VLSRVAVTGYEIHHGQTQAIRNDVIEVIPELAWCNTNGNVLGIYLHGLFENSSVLQALWGSHSQSLDAMFDGLADFLEAHMQAGLLTKLANV
jgi:adenosylcobyric acid synthase